MDSVGELERLARSFARHLEAENKSPKTVETYGEAVDQLIAYLASEAVTRASQVSTEQVEGFMVRLLELRAPATANNRFRALRQFFKWLVQEEYLPETSLLKGRLREIRDRARLRQGDVAEAIGRLQSFVSEYEAGQRRLDLVELRAVCIACGTTVRRLVDDYERRLKKGG
jgi:site-specific recombinase XerD